VAGSYYERSYLPPEPAPPLRLGPLVGATLITGVVASGVSVLIVGMASPSGKLALYLIPLVVWVVGGAFLLPPLIGEMAGVRITGETAVLALLAGSLTTFGLRFVVAEVFLHGSNRFAEPTPRSLGAALGLTWGAAFVGAWVSANLIRDRAKPLLSGYRPRVGGVIGIRALLVIGAGLLFLVAINVTDRNISKAQTTAKNATSGLTVLLYAEQLESTQSLVLNSYRVVTTSRPSSTAAVLRANIDALRGRARSLAATSPPGEDTLAPHRAFVAGLQSFVATLPRIGALRTSRAQRRAFTRAPGLRTMYAALTDLSLIIRREGHVRPVFEPDEWSAMLHGRT
jgi:hypothetical protein